MYERILAYHDPAGQPALVWLRLFTVSSGLVGIFSAVPGGRVTDLRESIPHAAATVLRIYRVPPRLLTVLTHVPLDGGADADSYQRVHLAWQATLQGLALTAPPEWKHVERAEVEALVGRELAPRAFWQVLAIPASEGRPALERWWCEVGRRRGDAWRIQGPGALVRHGAG